MLGGFKYKSGINLCNLAFVVLKSIHTELELRDIISAHPLREKDRPTEPWTSGLFTNSTAPSDTTCESSTSEPSTTALPTQQIIVSMISPSLAQAIIKRIDFSLLFAVEEYLQDQRLPINQLSLILKLIYKIFQRV